MPGRRCVLLTPGTVSNKWLPMKILLLMSVPYLSTLAESVDPSFNLPWPAQLGVIGMLGALLWWERAKTLPEVQRLHTIEINRSLGVFSEVSDKTNQNIASMTSEIKGMRKDALVHQKEWVKKLEARPCLGLEGLKSMEEAIKERITNGRLREGCNRGET